MELNEKIKKWGLPKCLEQKEIEYMFNRSGDFVLKDKNEEILFEMRFTSFENSRRVANQQRNQLTLHYIHVAKPEYRKKGIASFFLDNLNNYCKEMEITKVFVGVAKKSEKSEGIAHGNELGYDELKKLYENHLGVNLNLELS